MSIIPPFQPPQTTIEEVTPGRPIPHSGSPSAWFTAYNHAKHLARRTGILDPRRVGRALGILFRKLVVRKPSASGKGRWVMSPDEMSMWWLPAGEAEPEEPPIGGWDHA